MKLSTRQDTGLPAAELFAAISDFAQMERLLVRRAVEVRRLDPAREPGVGGMAWDLGFDLRGTRRELRLEVVQFDRPQRIVIRGQSEPLDLNIEMTVIALSLSRSRLIFELDARPRNMRARLMLQTAKLGKAQLDRKFAARVGGFIGDLAERHVAAR